MKKMLLTLMALAMLTAPAFAEEETVGLDVPVQDAAKVVILDSGAPAILADGVLIVDTPMKTKEPAPDGEYTLQNGAKLVVSGGKVQQPVE